MSDKNFAILENAGIDQVYTIKNIVVASSESVLSSMGLKTVLIPDGAAAQIGGRYNMAHHQFIPIAPFDTWKFNKLTGQWDAPVAYPTDGKDYIWDDMNDTWKEFVHSPVTAAKK